MIEMHKRHVLTYDAALPLLTEGLVYGQIPRLLRKKATAHRYGHWTYCHRRMRGEDSEYDHTSLITLSQSGISRSSSDMPNEDQIFKHERHLRKLFPLRQSVWGFSRGKT